MCLAIPMQIVERAEFDGTGEVSGVQRRISLMMCPEAEAGDYVLVHAGYAIGVVDEKEANLTLSLIEEALGGDLAAGIGTEEVAE